jgi:hypothetical protein
MVHYCFLMLIQGILVHLSDSIDPPSIRRFDMGLA